MIYCLLDNLYNYLPHELLTPKEVFGETITINDASNCPIDNIRIFGKTNQDGIPTIENPVEIIDIDTDQTIKININKSPNDSKTFNMHLLNLKMRGLKVPIGYNKYTYQDNSGNNYICDEINLKDNLYIQRIGKQIFTGEEKWYNSEGFHALAEWCKYNDIIHNNVYEEGFLSNVASRQNQDKLTNDYFSTHNLKNVNWILFKNSLTLEEWKNFLIQKHSEGNPVCVYYILQKPIIKNIFIPNYDNLYLNNKENIITNSLNFYSSVSYIVDLKKYIDNKISGI